MTTDFKALELRLLTNKSVIECKKALSLCGYSFESAFEYLTKGVWGLEIVEYSHLAGRLYE